MTAPDRIVVMYSCPDCGLKRVEVELPTRGSEDDVVAWMRNVVEPGLSHDHAMRSPGCSPDVLTDIMIPTNGRPLIGGPVVN